MHVLCILVPCKQSCFCSIQTQTHLSYIYFLRQEEQMKDTHPFTALCTIKDLCKQGLLPFFGGHRVSRLNCIVYGAWGEFIQFILQKV